MIIAGIIAEYNPMHSGHEYLINKVKHDLGADLVIAIMSGSYTERGIPAFFDKFSRTRQALNAGCDLVLELPVAVSTGTAEIFATGAIKALNAFGITHLAFGSECGDIDKLTALAALLNNESDSFKTSIKSSMASGSTYPQAIKNAVAKTAPELANLLDSPNNTLGIEYIKAIKTYAPAIQPYTITRLGASYNATENAENEFPSSTSLRASLVKDANVKYLCSDDFSQALNYKLLQLSDTNLLKYADVSSDFINRLRKEMTPELTFSTLVERIKTKQLTYNKVSRALFHILLDVTTEDYEHIKAQSPDYIRVLGLRKEAGKYLKLVKEASTVSILTRLAQDEKNLSSTQKEALSKDKASYQLYNQVYFYKYNETLESEYRGLIIV